MTTIEKVAIFLMILGAEKGQRILGLMDNGEINAVIPKIRKLTVLSNEIQESVWTEFQELGYEDKMNSAEVLTIIRFLFDGSKISSKAMR